MIKKILFSALAIALLAAPAFAGITGDKEGELTVNGQYFFPGDGDFDLFEAGYGAEVSYREWFSFPWGFGLSLGYANWTSDKDSNPFKYKEFNKFDGDVTTFPIGAHLFFNIIDWETWNLNFRTGLRYVIVDSDVDFYYNYDGKRHDVDLDNSVLWDLALELDVALSEQAYLAVSGGFQTDAMKAEASCDVNSDLRDASFEAFFGTVGVKILL